MSPGRVALAGLLSLLLSAADVRAQSVGAGPAAAAAADTSAVRWSLRADGAEVAWASPPDAAVPPDSAAAQALRRLQADGYYYARIDSALVGAAPVGTARRSGAHVLFATRGPRIEVGALRFEGVAALDTARLRMAFETKPARVFEEARLERDLDYLLAAYERAGYPLAQARAATRLDESRAPPTLAVTVRVDEGRTLRLGGVEPVPRDTSRARTRTSGAFVARVADLQPDAPLARYDPDAIRRRLEATELYEAVGTPYLVLDAPPAEGASDPAAPVEATLRVPLEERPPGTFDIALGYLPPEQPDDRGRLVGNGLLQLVNPFGGGRLFSLRLVRNPGLVSTVDVRVADPYVAGLPLRVEAAFEGRGQDSTFARQRYRLEVGTPLAPGLDVYGAFSRENTDPGAAGRRLGDDGLPLVPAADATFAGIGLRFRRLDRAVNPRRGLRVEALVEQGVKTRRFPGAADSVAAGFATSLRQQRLLADARVFVPTFARQVFVTGGDVAVLLSDVYDTAELFRYGGARSLRGYDEERFLGNVVARLILEYRYQIDRASFAFAFADVGYVARPAVLGQGGAGLPPSEGVEPGYGFGLQQRTPLGIITFSYALNPDDRLSEGKVHAGLAVGL